MKTSTKFLSGTLALAIIAMATSSSALAFRGNQENRMSSPAQVIEAFSVSDLSEADKELLIYGQQEERLAQDVYLALYEQYGLQVFANIARSEGQHVSAIGALLDRYNIPQTEGYGTLQDTYENLVAKGSLSLEDALEVGITIEILDIEDLDKTMSTINSADIQAVYTNLRKASVNHLNAFVRNLQQNGGETDLDWEQFTSQEELENRGNGNGNKFGHNRGGQGKGFGRGNRSGANNGMGRGNR